MKNLEQHNEVENKPKQYIFFKKIDALEKANFYEYLSVMIDGGVSIIEALDSVESKISSIYFNQKIIELITYISS
jgi:type II secretory pathway component PulF